MSTKLNKTVLGDNWFSTSLKFRLNPEKFLDRRKLTRSAFCLDVLKDLYSDYIDLQNKIHLLLLLQEYSSQLISDINLLEQIIESLTNLYRVLGKKSEKRLLKSHIPVAIVTILLTLNVELDVSNFIQKSKIFLLGIIYDSTEDSVITTSACSSLEELEVFYPGLLQSEIENILLAYERENSSAFQSYALLLNTCAKGVTTLCRHFRNDTGATETKDLAIASDSQVSPIITNLLEPLPLLSYTAQYRVLKNLLYIVKSTAQISPKTFKLYLNNLSLSSEVPLFHLAFDLWDQFGSSLYSDQEKKQLLKQLIKSSTHPCLTSSHRLLYLEWLKCIIKCDKERFLFVCSDFEALVPSPFDGPLTQEKKANVLTLCMPQDGDERLCDEFLSEAASGLVKCSLLTGGAKAAPSLFRTLFTYFATQQSESVYNSIYKLLIRIMKTSLHLTPYALSFIESTKTEHIDRNFHEKALGHMVEHILSVSVKQFQSNFDFYITILDRAAQESSSTCKPRAVLRLLQKLFNNKDINFENTWCIGNSILSLCRSLMKYHDMQIFYYDLAEVLCLIIQQFKDIDVKDRATIYYSMLTSLSKLKVQAIFNLQNSEKEGENTLSSFVTGNESLQLASIIQKSPKSILQLTRSEQNFEVFLNENNFTFSADIEDRYLEEYLHYINSQGSFVQIPFILKHVCDVEKPFTELFGIVIKTHTEPECQEVFDIKIPVLNKSAMADQGKKIFLRLKPAEPQPHKLYFKSEFTCSNGLSYVCSLQPAMLNMEDLFCPLPVLEKYKGSASNWRQALFDALWKTYTGEIKARKEGSKYCLSGFAMKVNKEDFPGFVSKRWQPFIVSQATGSYHIAIHLPPRSHLLLKTSIVNDRPYVNFIVDGISTLPWIAHYFQIIDDEAS